MYREFKIYVDGEDTGRIYGADSPEEAVQQYKDDCIALYRRNFGYEYEPDMEEFDDADIEANSILFG